MCAFGATWKPKPAASSRKPADRKVPLKGDGTSLGKFWVKPDCRHFRKQIDILQKKLRKQGKQSLKALCSLPSARNPAARRACSFALPRACCHCPQKQTADGELGICGLFSQHRAVFGRQQSLESSCEKMNLLPSWVNHQQKELVCQDGRHVREETCSQDSAVRNSMCR